MKARRPDPQPPVPQWILNTMPDFVRNIGLTFFPGTSYIDVTNTVERLGMKPLVVRALRENTFTHMADKSGRLKFYLSLVEPASPALSGRAVSFVKTLNTASSSTTLFGQARFNYKPGAKFLYIIALLPPTKLTGPNVKYERGYLDIEPKDPHKIGGTENVISEEQYQAIINIFNTKYNLRAQDILSANQESN